MRILVVEDTVSVRLVLATLLRKWGHDVIEASDGEQAWAILREDPVRLVICDWMMPELDGPGLCRRVRSADFEPYVYIILLTSRDDESDLVEGMGSGADDFVTKPFSRGELEARLKAGIRIIELQARLARGNRELQDAMATLRRDLEAAARTQVALLPERGAGFGLASFDWLYSPSMYIGGDTLGYFALDADHVAFYSIDVSGHGIPSALISVTLNKFITPDFCRLAMHGEDSARAPGEIAAPDEVVTALNDYFQNQGEETFFFTMLYGVHNHRSGRTSICQAAHPHPILVGGEEVIELGDGGMPVAMFDFADYEAFQTQIDFGDRLIIYSDGVTECHSPSGEQYGVERFKAFLARERHRASDALLTELKNELMRWSGSEVFEDDLSILLLERHAPADDGSVQPSVMDRSTTVFTHSTT